MHISPCVDLCNSCRLSITADLHLHKLIDQLQCEYTDIHLPVVLHICTVCIPVEPQFWTYAWVCGASLTHTSVNQSGSCVVWICAKLHCMNLWVPAAQNHGEVRRQGRHLWFAVEISMKLHCKSYTSIVYDVTVSRLSDHITEPSTMLRSTDDVYHNTWSSKAHHGIHAFLTRCKHYL